VHGARINRIGSLWMRTKPRAHKAWVMILMLVIKDNSSYLSMFIKQIISHVETCPWYLEDALAGTITSGRSPWYWNKCQTMVQPAMLVTTVWKWFFAVAQQVLEVKKCFTHVATCYCHSEDALVPSLQMGGHHWIEMSVRPRCSQLCK